MYWFQNSISMHLEISTKNPNTNSLQMEDYLTLTIFLLLDWWYDNETSYMKIDKYFIQVFTEKRCTNALKVLNIKFQWPQI